MAARAQDLIVNRSLLGRECRFVDVWQASHGFVLGIKQAEVNILWLACCFQRYISEEVEWQMGKQRAAVDR